MQKAKKYDWKDSNLALFGSDLEKNVKSKFSNLFLFLKIVIEFVSLSVFSILKVTILVTHQKFRNGELFINSLFCRLK